MDSYEQGIHTYSRVLAAQWLSHPWTFTLDLGHSTLNHNLNKRQLEERITFIFPTHDATALRNHLKGPKHTPYGELRSQHLSIAMSFHEDETHPFRCQYGCGGKFDLFNRLVQHLRDDDPLACGDTHDALRRQDGWDQVSFYPEFMTNGACHNKRVRDETGELVRPRRDFVEELRARGPHPKLRDLPDHFFAPPGTNLLESIPESYFAPPGTNLLEGIPKSFFASPSTNLLAGWENLILGFPEYEDLE
ncbi:hypothetical protein BOTNAR_0515g00030 [Botryotinia narcissicola]|uniref:C2H2-type domain-containing protein n=1 Tax=Botryotinia narcissicola TaxID=278944 RepID=A0A4Z1HLH4_9HELO|nr:hypothetical protein BOTNAR_0515g00030 [Botryotinia narcissicola]